MIFSADTSVKDISTFGLMAMMEDIQAELDRRQKEKAKSDMTALWQAIENFQKQKHYRAVLIDVDGNEIDISKIGEIYDPVIDYGFTFGPWIEED